MHVFMYIQIIGTLPLTETFKIKFGDNEKDTFTITVNYTEKSGEITVDSLSSDIKNRTDPYQINDMTLTAVIEFYPNIDT